MNISIPKIIHQIWWQGGDNIPDDYPVYSDSWIIKNPNYKYILWDENAINDILYEHFPWFVEKFNNMPKMIQKIDVAKYMILYIHGGIYVDMDSECVKSIDTLIENKQIMIVKLDETLPARLMIYGTYKDTLQNNFLASIPKHDFWIHCLKLIYNEDMNQKSMELHEKWIFRTTGPGLITNAFYSYNNNDNISLVGSDIVDPLTVCDYIKYDCYNNDCKDIFPSVYTIHHYGSQNDKYGWISDFGKNNMNFICTMKSYYIQIILSILLVIFAIIIVILYFTL